MELILSEILSAESFAPVVAHHRSLGPRILGMSRRGMQLHPVWGLTRAPGIYDRVAVKWVAGPSARRRRRGRPWWSGPEC